MKNILILLFLISLVSCKKETNPYFTLDQGTVPITFIMSGTGFTNATMTIQDVNYYSTRDTSITVNVDRVNGWGGVVFNAEISSQTPGYFTLTMTIKEGSQILVTKSWQSYSSGYFIEDELDYQFPQ